MQSKVMKMAVFYVLSILLL